MSKKALSLIAAVGTLAALAAGATPAAAENAQNDAHTITISAEADLFSARPGTPPDAPDIYYKLRTGPFEDEPNKWGGAYVDGSQLIVLYTNQDKSEAQDSITKLGIPDANISLKPTKHSMRELLSAVDQFTNNPTVATNGILSIGPQYSANRVLVGVDSKQLDDKQASELLAYVEGLDVEVEFFQTEPASPDSSRYAYDPPAYGGALIFPTGTTQGICSSAFAWINGTTRYLLTAAHCLDGPNIPDPRYDIRIPMMSGGSAPFGTVNWTSGHTYGTAPGRYGDVARYTTDSWATTTNRIWTLNGDTTTSRVVFSAASLPENWTGNNLRTSGASGLLDPLGGTPTGEAAPDWIKHVDRTLTYSDGAIWTRMSSGTSSNTCTYPGDSGGAWYLTSGAAAQPVGIHSGRKSLLLGGCEMHYTPVHVFANQTGGSVLTTS